MNLEIITKEDLEQLKKEVVVEMTSLIQNIEIKRPKKWGKGKELQQLFGGLGTAKIHTLRKAGLLKFREIGGSFIYDLEYAAELLDSDADLNVKINNSQNPVKLNLIKKKK